MCIRIVETTPAATQAMWLEGKAGEKTIDGSTCNEEFYRLLYKEAAF